MPTYEYRRKDGSTFEIRQGINDSPLTHCPDTGQPVYRIISGGAGVVYKGDGWYVKEYKNGPAHKSEAETDRSKTGDTDTKPATDTNKSGGTNEVSTSTSG